jgi:hypothetical protein
MKPEDSMLYPQEPVAVLHHEPGDCALHLNLFLYDPL